MQGLALVTTYKYVSPANVAYLRNFAESNISLRVKIHFYRVGHRGFANVKISALDFGSVGYRTVNQLWETFPQWVRDELTEKYAGVEESLVRVVKHENKTTISRMARLRTHAKTARVRIREILIGWENMETARLIWRYWDSSEGALGADRVDWLLDLGKRCGCNVLKVKVPCAKKQKAAYILNLRTPDHFERFCDVFKEMDREDELFFFTNLQYVQFWYRGDESMDSEKF